jgi:hypothetical protein
MQPNVRVQHCTDGAAARIAKRPPSCLDPTAIPGLRVVWAQSKGIERGTRLHATEEPHARIHPNNARSLAIGTTLTERSYIIPRWRPISQELVVYQPVCYGSSDPIALRHRTLAQRTPTSIPTTQTSTIVRNTSTHMAAVTQCLRRRLRVAPGRASRLDAKETD